MSALVGERRAGGEKKREGWRAGVWMGAGTVEKSRFTDKKKTRPRNRGNRPLLKFVFCQRNKANR